MISKYKLLIIIKIINNCLMQNIHILVRDIIVKHTHVTTEMLYVKRNDDRYLFNDFHSSKLSTTIRLNISSFR